MRAPSAAIMIASAVALTALHSTPLQAQDAASPWELFTEADFLFRSKSLPIRAFVGDDEDIIAADFNTNGNETFTSNIVATGVRRGAWEIAAILRYDAKLNYTPDTAFLYVQSERNQQIPDGGYDVDFAIDTVLTYGLRLGYTHDVTDRLSVRVRLSGLLAEQPLDGDLVGHATFENGDLSDAVFLLDYRYDEDRFFDRVVNRPIGHGTAADVSAVWTPKDSTRIQVEALDLFHRIWWDDLPRTAADASASTISRNSQGLIVVRPVLQGANTEETHTQSIRRRFRAEASHALNSKWTIRQDGLLDGGTVLTTSSVDYTITDFAGSDLVIGPEVEWTTGALGFNFDWHGLSASIASNNFRPSDASYLRFAVGFRQQF